MFRGHVRSLLPISLVIAVVGCSGAGGPSISGKVLLDGNPLTDADVEFEKRDKAGLATFAAKTDAEGKFQVPVIPGRKIDPGTYQVLITKWVDKKGKATPSEEVEMLKASGQGINIVPGKYSDPDFPNLKAEIKEGLNELPPFELVSKGK